MDLAGKKILVTGAGGFIGSHLAEELVGRGLDVRAFVHYNSRNSFGWLDRSPPDTRRSLDVVAGDIRDANGVRAAMQGRDVVFHLAALIGIPYSYHSPGTYIDTNVTGTLNVVQAARELGISRVVHTSTSEVYGTARFVPVTEEHPLQAQSPYSASKAGADQIALAFRSSFGVPVTIVRPFNTYGPRQSARAVIPSIITQIAGAASAIRLGALHPTRDFSHVADTVAGFIAVAESDAAVGEVINIGSNFEISIGEVVEVITDLMGARKPVEVEDLRVRPQASEVERLWADNSKALALTGWRPSRAGREGLRRGLRETIRWFADPENLKLYEGGRYTI